MATPMGGLPKRVVIREVGLRDGLQSLPVHAAYRAPAYMLASMGIDTGVDLAALFALRGVVREWLQGESLHGAIYRAGLPKTIDRPRGVKDAR